VIHANTCILGLLEVLIPDRRDGFEVAAAGNTLVQMLLHPALQRRSLLLDDLDRRRFLARIAPVDVEPGLDARAKKQRNARLAADLSGARSVSFATSFTINLRCVPSRVDRVFNPPGPAKGG
jgi:hypothetical protein